MIFGAIPTKGQIKIIYSLLKINKMNPIKDTILITKKQFETELFSRFGLKIDFETITKYQDFYNCNADFYNIKNPLVFTISYIDRFGFGWANIYGEFYKNHTNQKSELFKEFKEFINTYTFKHKNHYLIN